MPGARSSAATRAPAATRASWRPCDQDDVWQPDKLAALSGALERRRDARLLRPADRRRRRERALADLLDRPGATWDDLGAELQTNVVTGAACLVRREVLEVALPFPAELDGSFHDHWLAVCALALGELAYVDRPLVDYVQHGANVVGWSRRRRRASPPAASRRRCGPRATASAISSARGCGRTRCSSACHRCSRASAARWSARRAPACHGWRPARCASSCARGARSKRGGGRCAARCGGEGAPRGTAASPPRARRRRRRRAGGTASGGRRRGPCGPPRAGPRRRSGRPAWRPCRAASQLAQLDEALAQLAADVSHGLPSASRFSSTWARPASVSSKALRPSSSSRGRGPRPRAARARGRSSRGSGARRRRCAPRSPA